MKYEVYDSETTIRNMGDYAIGSMWASPFYPGNIVVTYGELGIKGGEIQVRTEYDADGKLPPPIALQMKEEVLVIGHNLPFDLEYMWKMWPNEFWKKLPTLHIWDTQQAAYLLSGQEKLFASLDSESEERGLPLKDNRVKKYWDEGIDTPLIPQDLLVNYMVATDLHNPLAIFRDQYAQLSKNPKLMALMKVKMDDILLTTVMSIYGMHFDLPTALAKAEELETEVELLRQKLIKLATKHFVKHFDFDPASDDDISLAAYGGKYKVVENVIVYQGDEPYVYKSGQKKGQVKTKKEKIEYVTKGFKLPPGISPKMKNGLYSTEEQYLSKIQHPFIELVLKFRELAKDLSTYYTGYSKLVFPDEKLHPQFNHSAVKTGRQSCSQPNLQNVTVAED